MSHQLFVRCFFVSKYKVYSSKFFFFSFSFMLLLTDYDNVDPHADDIGNAEIRDIGDADNDDVSAGMGAGSSGVGCGANAESLPTVDARAVPLPSLGPPIVYCEPT